MKIKMTKPFKISIFLLLIVGSISATYFLFVRYQEDQYLLHHAAINWVPTEYASYVRTQLSAMLGIFNDCEPREMIHVESSPPRFSAHLEQGDKFKVKCCFGEPIYAALQDKGKIDKLKRIVKVLAENGMTEVTFIDYRSKQEIVKYSIKSGWENFTDISIDFSL